MDKVLFRIHISGRVQGVGYRYSARTMARYLGLKGFVKNLPDGRVYIEAEGDRASLHSFIEWCRKGTGHGFVENVEKEEDIPAGYEKFDIR